MKIAVLISGQPRFTIGFKSFLSNLIGYKQADYFCYISKDDAIYKSDIPAISTEWASSNLDWEYKTIQSILNNTGLIKSLKISDDIHQVFPAVDKVHCVTNTDNVFKMFYNIYQANKLREDYEKENNFKYDLVIRTRPDLSLESVLDLNSIKLEKKEILMPNNAWFGDPLANDVFAAGSSDAMSIYADLYPLKIKEYNNNGVIFHPESILGAHLLSNQIRSIPGDFNVEIKRSPNITLTIDS